MSGTYDIEVVEAFLDDLVTRMRLPVGLDSSGARSADSPLGRYGPDPTFVVAMTGVGKTLAIPVRDLLHACNLHPPTADDGERRVYVVEPRIPICEATQRFLNSEYANFLGSAGLHSPLFGCITSATGKMNDQAPILFITTGILESLVLSGELDKQRHRVIIDEAHVTIERNPGIELCIATMRHQQIPLSYMSATVDTTGLERELGVRVVEARTRRHPVLMRMLPAPLSRANPERTKAALQALISELLLDPRPEAIASIPNSPLDRVADVEAVRRSLNDEAQERPVGMLIIVNSHQSENSDTRFVANLIRNAAFNKPVRRVEVLRLASQKIRNAEAYRRFRNRVSEIEARNGRYVIVATNVVEMGVTFQSIDIVVTLDSEIETVTTREGTYLQKRPLSVNALYQRAGRAGRLRPGICFISEDVGAPYTKLTPGELDAGLPYDRLTYPLQTESAQLLAMATFAGRVPDVGQWLRTLPFPSAVREGAIWHERAERSVEDERKRLLSLRIATGCELSSYGRLARRELVSITDLRFVTLLGAALEDEVSLADLIEPLTVLAAASDKDLADFVRPSPEFKFNGRRVLRVLILDADELGARPDGVRDVLRGSAPWESGLSRLGLPRERIAWLLNTLKRGFTLASGTGTSQARNHSDYLVLEEEVVRLSSESDLISVYEIVRHYFNRYSAVLQNSLSTEFDRQAVRTRAELEAAEVGVSFPAVDDTIRSYLDIRRRLKRRPNEVAATPAMLERATLLTSIQVVTADLLLRTADQDTSLPSDVLAHFRSELTRRDGEMRIADFGWVQSWLQDQPGLSVAVRERVWESLFRPAVTAATQHVRRLQKLSWAGRLPPLLAKGKRLVEFVRESGVFQRFTLALDGNQFSTPYQTVDGRTVDLMFDPEGSPISPGLDSDRSKRPIELLGRPRWGEVRAGRDAAGSERVLRLGQVTVWGSDRRA